MNGGGVCGYGLSQVAAQSLISVCLIRFIRLMRAECKVDGWHNVGEGVID
jgi:hypothetical protein